MRSQVFPSLCDSENYAVGKSNMVKCIYDAFRLECKSVNCHYKDVNCRQLPCAG